MAGSELVVILDEVLEGHEKFPLVLDQEEGRFFLASRKIPTTQPQAEPISGEGMQLGQKGSTPVMY